MRLEQLYPFPDAELDRVLARYDAQCEIVWAQEEPKNMGPWRFVREQFLDGCLREARGRQVRYVGRGSAASPAARLAQGARRGAGGPRRRRAPRRRLSGRILESHGGRERPLSLQEARAWPRLPPTSSRRRETLDSAVIRFCRRFRRRHADHRQPVHQHRRAVRQRPRHLSRLPAEIRAPAGTLPGVSGFQLHFASSDVFTPGDAVDVLVAMNPAALR